MTRITTEPLVTQRRSRRFVRKEVNLDAEFSPINIKLNVAQNIGTVHGLIRNMSSAGLFAELPVLYRVGTRFQVRFRLEERILAFYAIVWRVDLRQEIEKPAVYGHGLKITTASEETLHEITSFVNFGR